MLNLVLTVSGQHFIDSSWAADYSAVRSARYNRNLQNPGSACSPSPCGRNTHCMANGQGNPICSCVEGHVPMPSPVDGCVPVTQNPRSPVIIHNRLSGGPGHLQLGGVRAPEDPCQPSPCGPGTTCSTNRDGNPVCRCQAGYSPNPDTITGCKPECTRDPDCRMGLICRSLRCVQKPDPCQPNPCGPGASCSVNGAGNAICQCQAGLIPKPDTITGCGPECVRDPDCQTGYICQGQRCVIKPDPCDPSPCGPGAVCQVTGSGNAICRCSPGLIPNPDTISGCKPECIRDPDCPQGYVCESQRCVEAPDPCVPSPCGPGADCSVTGSGNAICRCQPGLVPKPDTITGCGPECVTDPDCQSGYICQSQRCVVKPDPCDPSPCGPGAVCTVNLSGNPICRCEPGLVPKPDTITGCGPECVRDPDCRHRGDFICQSQRCVVRPDPCQPSPCGPNTFCTNAGGNPICKCNPGYIPAPDTITGCDRECVRDPDCQTGYVCRNYQCEVKPDPCDPSPCGPNTMCTSNNLGNPICRCLAGYIPGPDTITGCKRECEVDPDCSAGYICSNYRCVEKPDPCSPSPCGPNTECTVTPSGNPICRCLPTYIPQPDTITGCGRECERDQDCSSGNICQSYRCVPRPDPCDPSPCGPNTECNVNRLGNPVCTCIPGFSPSPDTITGCAKIEARTPPPDPCVPSPCGPNTRCEVNSYGNPVCKCLPNYVPLQDTIQGCRENNPCEPDPCGVNAQCSKNGQSATCRCPSGYRGDPYVLCRQGDCDYDRDCPALLACFDYNCGDPCRPGTCGSGALCQVRNHRPVCSCPEGFRGDPLVACEKNVVIGGRHAPAPRQEPRNTIVIGQQYSDQQPEGRTANVSPGVAVIGHSYTAAQQPQAQRRVVGANAPAEPRARVQPQTRGDFVVVGSTRKRRNLEKFLEIIRENRNQRNRVKS